MKKQIWHKLLTHATIILAALFLTITVIDRFNPQMEFLNSDVTDIFLIAFSSVALVSSVVTAAKLHKHDK